ncbi:MAG: hypothetical protein CMQ24_15190 [Gammaproteobacteria bacterium]|nr:hypothetical protein [Gammaproteobacteria bacterium]
MLNLKLAYRNLFRNVRRTVLTVLLIASSLAALILADAMIGGLRNKMVEGVTHLLSGEAQVHRTGYLDTLDADLFLPDPDALLALLADDPAVRGYAPRAITGGMVSSPYNVAGGFLYGIVPERERDVSRIAEAVVRGEYLTGATGEILMGTDLADLLEVDLGDRIVVTVAQVDGGELSQALFRLSGITDLGVRELDSSAVFVNLGEAQVTLGLARGVHEIAIRYAEGEDSADVAHPLLTRLNATPAGGPVEALGWMEFNPGMGQIVQMTAFSTLIMGSVLFLIASFGVINSMFMSIYERIYEFGVIKALGSRPTGIVGLVLWEATLIALLSCLVGLLLGGSLAWHFSVNGMSLGEFDMAGMTVDKFDAVVRFEQFVNFPIYVTILTLIAALYPARFAARIVPTEALQKTL